MRRDEGILSTLALTHEFIKFLNKVFKVDGGD